jgi:hypothetical protein
VKRETTKADTPLPAGLPKALRPWSQAFQHMPEANLRLIGDLMAQLNPLLRETFEIDVQSYGEFNGYDGMAMRGEMERLLPSQWLWRELAPVEFLRRFAEQELLFHRPSFESPTDERTHLVAIDCGPGMLGRPRLVALAALLCLNAIAREQSARLLWIAPHAEVNFWQPVLTQKDIRAFLLSANPLALRAGQLEELVQALPEGAGGSELLLWTIGAAPLAPADETIKTNQIVITERMTLTPDGAPIAEARVDFHAHAGRRKDAVLAFPKEEDCVAVLREPYRAAPSIRGPVTAKPQAEGEANPFWAPREVVLLDDPRMAVLRVREGILGLRISADGQLDDPLLIRLESYDNLLGLHWGRDFLHLALTRKYNTFSSLRLKRLQFHGPAPIALEEIADLRLDENAPAVINKHPRNALPPLLKPGRRFRLLAVTAKGEQFVLHQDAAERHSQIPQLAMVGYRDGWAFVFLRVQEKRLLIARNLITAQCQTFALPENADVVTLDDIVYWPEIPHHAGWMLMARCNDGHWRGRRGRANMRPYGGFPGDFIDIDLSHLGRVVPLGTHPNEKGASTWRFWLWSPENDSVHRCDFAANRSCQIEPLDLLGAPTASHYNPANPPHPILRGAISKSFLFTWDADAQGYVVRIDGGYSIDHPPGQTHMMRSHDVAELIARARCLSA